ncbi:uncharacterized protein DDB_G0286299-like isoform X2 [Euwallacea similis]|uniref:uncharacterized protein DDB_G0286299-like isoform X2 n=1 Tax=Euwallacea similis TaxID=1736056 RepID=UPI0034506886
MKSSSNQLKKHLDKSKLSKQDLIDNILNQTLNYIKVKKEPLTESDSSEKINKKRHKSKDKLKSRRSTGNEEKELSTKQRRKSLSANQIFDFSISENIKTEKLVDDKKSSSKKNERNRDSVTNSSEDEKLVSQKGKKLENFISKYSADLSDVNEKDVTPLKSNLKLSNAWSSPKKDPDYASENIEHNISVKGQQKNRILNVVENIIHKEKISKKTETDSQQSTSGFESEPRQLQAKKTNNNTQSPKVEKSTKKSPKKKNTQLETVIDKQPLIINAPNKHINVSRRDSSSDSSSTSDVGQTSNPLKPKYKLSGSKKFISTTESTNSDDEEMTTEIDRIIQMTVAENKRSVIKSQNKTGFRYASKRKKTNESYSSSDEDAVPKPIQIKSETRLKNTTVPVALPMKNESPYGVTEWKEADDSKSSSDTELPPPKKIALKAPSSAETSTINVLQNDCLNSSFCAETPNFKKMSWLDKLKQKYPALQEQSHTNINFPGTNVKYSILMVPKHIHPQSLSNLKTKHFTKGKTVKVNDKDFICEVLPVKPDPVIVAFKAPKLIEPQSMYCLREFLPSLMPLSELKSPEKQYVALPSQIKNKRHPLFGGNYKNKVKLSEEVCKQLQEAVERKSKAEEKERKKHKFKKTHISRDIEENVLNIFNSIGTTFENNHVLAKSGKKSSYGSKSKFKRKDLSTTSEELDFTVLEENNKKRKRKSS